jgi:aryl-phospho-beta-D-glucosidase BglC (GH1 family)
MKPTFMLLLTLVIVFYSCTRKEEAKTSLTFLHTSGQYMVNEQNDTILLRGVGLGNWLLPEGYMWHFGEAGDRPRKIEKIVEDLTSPEFNEKFWKEFRLNYITEADIIKVKEMGFNSVRPALNARVFMTEGDTAVFIEENFALLDSLISWCGKHEIYVILDMHGAPGGQTGQNIDDSPNNEPELFMDPKFEHRLTRLWMKLVERYKDNPVVAGYDLLNEPLPENTGAAEKYKHLLEPMYKNLTAKIREIDKKHMIILEGYNWSNNWSEFGEPFDDNLVYQFHYYCWSNPDHLNDISYFLKERERLNVPVWVGETGERNPVIYFATAQYFEKNNIGWSFWPWKKIDNRQVIYSVNAPAGYDKVIEYSRGGAKLSKDSAEMIFTQLLENIKVENCEYLEHITKAWFRKVPAKIYAVNYGHDGEGISYTVNDTTKAEYYRTTEPVKTVLLPNTSGQRRASEIAVLLNEGEGTLYTVFATEDFNSTVKVKAKTTQPNSNFKISVNDTSREISLPDTTWTELVIENQNFVRGKNTLKAEVLSGILTLQYFDIQKN